MNGPEQVSVEDKPGAGLCCPNCERAVGVLQQEVHRGVKVATCKHCDGVWMDRKGFERLLYGQRYSDSETGLEQFLREFWD